MKIPKLPEKKLNKIYNFISKEIAFYIILIIGFIFFKSPIESFLSNQFVEPFFSKMEADCINDTIFYFVGSCIILFTSYKLFLKYIPSKRITILLVILSFFYCYYRCSINEKWYFISLNGVSCLKYADLLIVITVCNVVLFVNYFRKKTTPKNSKDSFLDDQPIDEKTGEDKLKYNGYAKTIAEKILNSNFKKSFAIGVNAKWGLGKTSFINLIKRNLNEIKPDSKENNFIEIEFNPWNSQNPENIIQDFFATLQKEIQLYHSSLARLFTQYSNKLLNFKSNFFTQVFHAIVSLFTGFESIDSLHKKLNEALGKINRKLIIYIDDLDRLDSKEILEVIRLVRNTANFKNTFFVVAYDRNYVINALEQQNSYKPQDFLEKIFQLEIILPYFDKGVLIKELVEKLEENFPQEIEQNFPKIDTNLENVNWENENLSYLIEWLENLRDVTRLANAMRLNYSLIKSEVDFNDFMKLELLRLKYPSVYYLISSKKENLFYISYENEYKIMQYAIYELKDKKPEKGKNDVTDRMDEVLYGSLRKLFLEEYLREHYKELSIPEKDVNRIYVYVKKLFSTANSQLSILGFSYKNFIFLNHIIKARKLS